MKTIKYLGMTALIALLAAGCSDFDEQTGPAGIPFEGRLVTKSIPLRVTNELDEQGREIPLSRAFDELSDAEDSAIENVWVFQFSEPEAGGDYDSRRLIRSTYIDDDAIDAAESGTHMIEVDLIESGMQEHLLVFVANINEADYGWEMVPGRSTYAELKSRFYRLRTNTEDSRLYGDEWRNIIMSGKAVTTIAEGDGFPIAGIPLTRSLAKIRLELTLANPDYKVLSVKLRDMPDSFRLAEALDESSQQLDNIIPSVIDFPIESNYDDGLVNNGETKTIVWYVPRHERGSNLNITTPADKNRYAPAWATYIEIMAKNINTGAGVLYRIYPGADKTDFNILPNHRYLVKQTITGNGGENLTDSRIEQFGDVYLDGHSNSFILNPPISEGMGPRTYYVPITRVNEYWAPDAQSFPGYGGLNEGAILTNTRWRVDLLWQDSPDMVRAESDTPSRIYISKAIGKGPDDYFAITVPDGAIHGNFVMALRIYNPSSSQSEEYQIPYDQVMWSWHFWVTDYNPDRMKFVALEGDKFVYPVPGGQVERYGGAVWGYDTPGSAVANNWNNYTYNTSSTAPYAKAFMMDRSIGALNNGYSAYSTKEALTYQFGRKDPFSGSTTLYNIDGVALTATAPDGFEAQRWNGNANGLSTDIAVKVSESVNNPMKFYSRNNPWATDVNGFVSTASTDGYMWFDVRVPMGVRVADVKSYKGKSIFDPCPPGWKIPTTSVWEDFRQNNTAGHTVSNSTHNRDFPNYTTLLQYWPNIEVDGQYPVEGKIHYSNAHGRRNTSGYDGNHYTSTAYSYAWSATPATALNAYCFYYRTTSSTLTTNSSIAKGYAMRVRCVSMEEE